MKASADYCRYLRHFGRTVPVCEMHWDLGLTGIALRHDVDYDLEAALALGRAEAEMGCRSTYYLLHSADYWNTSALGEAARELERMGHEVGLHLNVLAEWYEGRTADPRERLSEVLGHLRGTGVGVIGCAAHGDRVCYRGNFANHWMLKELRGEAPAIAEEGISAEGIPDERPRFQLHYPEDHQLKRPDGQRVCLWSVPMTSLGLDYHAVHVTHDRYFTDSGGAWKRSPDPLKAGYQGGRWQVLIHPEYWTASPRIIVSFGEPTERQLDEAARRGYIPVSAEGVAAAAGDLQTARRRRHGKLRSALLDVQCKLPQRADALIYGMPESLRSMWPLPHFRRLGRDEIEDLSSWIPRDSILLQGWGQIQAGAEPSFLSCVGIGLGVKILLADGVVTVRFPRRESKKLRREVAFLDNGRGILGGRGNWRISLELESDQPESALYLAAYPRTGWLKFFNQLRPRARSMALQLTNVRCCRTMRRVTGLPVGRSRVTFRYSQLLECEGFLPAIRPERALEGTVRVFRLWIERAEDCFFSAKPVLEALEMLESRDDRVSNPAQSS